MSLRTLRLLAAVELGSLLILLVNLATIHLPVVATLLGPVHGCAYLTAIVLTARRCGLALPTLLCFVPGIGSAMAVAIVRDATQ